MRTLRFVSILAATITGGLLAAAPAHADPTIQQQFRADSGDSCRYGVTEGTLNWVFGATSPLPVLAVDVRGTVTDHPTPADPALSCRDDGFFSTASFTASSGSVAVARQQVSADNAVAAFQFRISSSTAQHIDRVTVQVCRAPVHTLPPSYCGTPVTYPAPPVG